MRVYINQDNWACELPSCYLLRDNNNLFVDVEDELFNDMLQLLLPGQCLRYVDKKWTVDIYNNEEYQAYQNKLEIKSLKQEIIKVKEDVEQVELFGMERVDFNQKKARCVEIIMRLRELEAKK